MSSHSNTPQAHVKAAQKYQQRHRDMGLCYYCPEPSVNGWLCQGHKLKVTLRRAARYQRQKAAVPMPLPLQEKEREGSHE